MRIFSIQIFLFSLNSIRLTIYRLNPNCENISVCNCKDTYFRLLVQSETFPVSRDAAHWEMNAIAPYGFIVEECSRGVNIVTYHK